VISCPIPYSKLPNKLLSKLGGIPLNLSGKYETRLEISLI
jgi:hypothetical protein